MLVLVCMSQRFTQGFPYACTLGLPVPFAPSYMAGRKDKRTNNRTMIPTLKHNEPAGSSENSAFKGAGLLCALNLSHTWEPGLKEKLN